MERLRPWICFVVVLLLVAVSASDVEAGRKKKKEKAEDEESGPPPIAVEAWLVLGPMDHPLPVFHDESRGGYDLQKLLDAAILPDAHAEPEEGATLTGLAGERFVWHRKTTTGDAIELPRPEAAGVPAVGWLAAYVSAPRWQSFTLKLAGNHRRAIWVDGESVASGGAAEDDEVSGTVKLRPGRHLLLVQTVLDPDREAAWTIGATLTPTQEEPPAAVEISIDRTRGVELRDILDPPRISSLALSPSGQSLALSVSRTVPGTHDSESWVEIRAADSGRLQASWRGTRGARQVDWSTDGRYISYVANAPSGEGSALFLYDTQTDDVRPLLEKVEKLGRYVWSPTGTFIVYSTRVEPEKNETGIKRLESIRDRWSDFRTKQYLHQVRVPDGTRRRLTAGGLTTSLLDIAPDGGRLLFTRTIEDVSTRPYSKTELWELDLHSLGATALRTFGWMNGASYSPKGERLLISGPPDAFGDSGRDVPEGTLVNYYDGQLFLWNPADDSVEAITRDFDPAVGNALWSRYDGEVYFSATEHDLVRLYRYDIGRRAFEPIETGFETLGSFLVADDAPRAVALVSSTWRPQALVSIDLQEGSAEPLAHPSDEWFEEVETGTIEDWDFTAANGKTIEGRIYLPPGFDAGKKYSLIVYYYGGTVPVSRSFGGRYPKEWWASQGYVVYVPQPSGATGFGQAFSAAHVNDWGKTSSEEIIEGTRKFLAAHSYVDPERVGCIGASYGGFMTMLLSTKTDLYAAAVAHAGISSISSYWGEGYWGYAYSAVATAESFPWNRRDIYVDQSPLFRADENRVPILLTHGASDTNVPVGESDQFYIALKLLGKEVEYIRIAGEDHWILTHEKRQIWSRSIVAWFDRWLKDEPDWWYELYPSSKPEQGDDGKDGDAEDDD